jgi:hypothetical protein
LALRLLSPSDKRILVSDADLRSWLPGDNVYDGAVVVPADTAEGQYELQIGVLDERFDEPDVKLAIEGRRPDGWHNLGKISVQR